MNKLREWLRSIFRKVVAADEFADFLKDMGTRYAEKSIGLDLDGDGIISSLDEIRAAGREYGLNELTRVAEEIATQINPNPARIKKYLAIARLAVAIALRFGADRMPMFRLLELAVIGGFVDTTAADVTADLRKKGIR